MERKIVLKEACAARDSIYGLLRKRIVQFDLLPGETLSENTLAAELGVSRSPVRDALSRLVDEGCVVVYPQRGTQVSYISLPRVRQFVFMRTVLEKKVLEELCETGLTGEQIAEIEESLRRQRRFYETQATNELLYEDLRMHRLLYEFCGHESAWEPFDMLDCDTLRVSCLQIRTYSYKVTMAAVDSWENVLIEHRMMLDALRRRDAEAVCLLSSRHIEQIVWSGEDLRRIYPQYFESNEA